MPRYLIERTFSEELQISTDSIGVDECLKIVSKNLDDEVTDSYIITDFDDDDIYIVAHAVVCWFSISPP